MKTLWHLVKYNFIFYKVRLGFLSVLAAFMVLLVYYFMESYQDFGEGIMQYSSYILFVLFTGRFNARNSQMFDIKHLQSLPLSKKEIVIKKSLADIVIYLPIAIPFLWGFSIKFPQYHISLVSIGFVFLLGIANIISFSKRIDFFRIQHSKSHLSNMFLYFHKYLELLIVITIGGISISGIWGFFGKNILMLEYSVLVLLVVVGFIASMNALKMLKDETLSYFMYKRDFFRMGWKLLVFIIPAIGFHHVYKGKLGHLETYGKGKIPLQFVSSIESIKNLETKRFVMAVLSGDQEAFQHNIEKKQPIPWEISVNGMHLVHMATFAGNQHILATLLERSPDKVNQVGSINQTTPLFMAMRKCRLDLADMLIDAGATIKHKDKQGDTALIYAARYRCSGGVLKLVALGADPTIKNKKNISALDLLKKQKNGMFYLVNQQFETERAIASDKPKED